MTPSPAAERRERLRRNLAGVSAETAAACARAGRDPAGVRLVAVTKYVDAATARLLHELGCHDLGETRPQSLWEKAAALADVTPSPRWHLVGHLQRNKLRRTLPVLGLLHSLDSRRLLDALEAEAAAAGVVCETLVEVNLTADPGRTGVAPEAAGDLIAVGAGMRHVRVRGLMGMAAVPDGRTDASRRDFARLRELRDRLAAELPAAGGLPELSMGMSGDFAEAILEGATLVRIGSALFEGVG
jgi:pyridoxal phosphate enzyme (YggS family)